MVHKNKAQRGSCVHSIWVTGNLWGWLNFSTHTEKHHWQNERDVYKLEAWFMCIISHTLPLDFKSHEYKIYWMFHLSINRNHRPSSGYCVCRLQCLGSSMQCSVKVQTGACIMIKFVYSVTNVTIITMKRTTQYKHHE
jgi:hypothetical protein